MERGIDAGKDCPPYPKGVPAMKKILAALIALAFVAPTFAEEKAAAPAPAAKEEKKMEKKAKKAKKAKAAKEEKKAEKKAEEMKK
jgi:Ni/Co efflux regulator RcnB